MRCLEGFRSLFGGTRSVLEGSHERFVWVFLRFVHRFCGVPCNMYRVFLQRVPLLPMCFRSAYSSFWDPRSVFSKVPHLLMGAHTVFGIS